MKTIKLLMCMSCMSLGMLQAATPTQIGGMMRENVPLYRQHNGGTLDATSMQTFTVDYKLVTVNSKTYAWAKTCNGSLPGNADWEAQLRFYTSTLQKTENNLPNKNNTTKEITGTTTASTATLDKITFFLNIGGFIETALLPYDPSNFSNTLGSSTTAPILNMVTADPSEVSTHLTFASSKPDKEMFYYIEDESKGISTVSLSADYTLTGLTANTNYNLSITPFDFYGNQGSTVIKSFTTKGMVHITSGIAQDIRFILKSSANTFECYIEPTDPTRKLHSAAVQVTTAGGSQFELTNPSVTISPDGSYAYIKSTDARLNSQTIAVNIPYLLLTPTGEFPGWEAYVTNNKTITAGSNIGLPIMHTMGQSSGTLDTTKPILNSVTLIEQALDYVVLNIQGSDNSGLVYYEITGGKETVNVFKTGNYFFTSFDKGKAYTLQVTAKDFTGNASTQVEEIKFKSYARSTIFNGDNLNYNTTIKPTGNGGELGATISYDGTTLTLGCTTNNDKLGTAKERTFWSEKKPAFAPTVKINGKTYTLTTASESETTTTASISFSGMVDTTPLLPGTILQVQWNVFWNNNNGNFFTGTFIYKVGDYGQADTCQPTAPNLSVTDRLLQWNACTDAITTVTKYEVYNGEVLGSTIADHGEASFQYNIPTGVQNVKVIAYDMTGNSSEATINLVSTHLESAKNNYNVMCRDGVLSIYGLDVKAVDLYSVTGQLIDSTNGNYLQYKASKHTIAIAIIETQEGGRYAIKVSLQ